MKKNIVLTERQLNIVLKTLIESDVKLENTNTLSSKKNGLKSTPLKKNRK
jgi:hypothetical protein